MQIFTKIVDVAGKIIKIFSATGGSFFSFRKREEIHKFMVYIHLYTRASDLILERDGYKYTCIYTTHIRKSKSRW